MPRERKGGEGGSETLYFFRSPVNCGTLAIKQDQSLSDAGGWGGGQGFLWRSDGFHRGMISCCQQSLAGEL